MPLSVNFDGLLQAAITEQEDEKEEESKIKEYEELSKDYIRTSPEFGISDNLTISGVRNLENYFKIQDASYFEKELKDMMESVKRFQDSLSENAQVDKIFKFRSEDFRDQNVMKNKDNLNTLIEEIEKMDAVLKLKVSEEKKAKFSRIQAEEESRNILTMLPCPKRSGGMKINLEEFMRLLKEVENNDSLSSCKESEMSGILMSEHCGSDIKDSEKKERAPCQKQKTNNSKFVERNIQLAKCGRGTLSLTDEEKSRIESLLANVENSKTGRIEELKETGVSNAKNNSENEIEVYGMDDETKSILSQIDERLQTMAEMRRQERPESRISCLNKSELENKVVEEREKDNKKDHKKEEKKERNRLKKINQLLNCINSVSGEEIHPLTEEQLESLIRESKKSNEESETESKEIQCPKELITELVSNAKLLMPKFKYRFNEC